MGALTAHRPCGIRAIAIIAATASLVMVACSGEGSDGTAATVSPQPTLATTTTVPPPASTTSTTILQATTTTTTTIPAVPRYTTANTPIGTLLADPASSAILVAHVPSFATGPMVDLVSHTTLKGIQGYAYTILTDEVLAQIDAELAELTPLSPENGGGPLYADVNYDEAMVGPYELPDPLVLANGDAVESADAWWSERRPEILADYEELVYGRSPDRPAGEHFEIVETSTPAFDGAALRQRVTIHLTEGTEGPAIDLVSYVPANADGPVPMLLVLGFDEPMRVLGDPSLAAPVADPSLPAAVTDMAGALPTAAYLDAGFGVAAINHLQLDPDTDDGYPESVRAYFDAAAETERSGDSWGAIAAWGWGLSRAQDYLETDAAVDADRVAIYGASRLGRAVLWAGARDDRFAAVISCCSGKFGGALLRRDFGDALDTLPARWFAPNLQPYLHDIDSLPVDSNMLLSLIAPRPVLLQTGRYDHAADPKGEYLAAVAAGPVFELLGSEGLGTEEDAWPVEEPILGGIGYFMHDGGHGTAAEDWDVFLTFLQQHLG